MIEITRSRQLYATQSTLSYLFKTDESIENGSVSLFNACKNARKVFLAGVASKEQLGTMDRIRTQITALLSDVTIFFYK